MLTHDSSSDRITDDRLLSRETCETLWDQVRSLARGGGRTAIKVTSYWNGELRWARNRVHLAVDRRDIHLRVVRVVGRARAAFGTNQLDASALERAVRGAEAEAQRSNYIVPLDLPIPDALEHAPETKTWNAATMSATETFRAQLAATLSRESEGQGMLSAGYLEVRGATRAYAGMSDREGTADRGYDVDWSEELYDPPNHDALRYHQMTQAQCSMTVRHPKGTGSGWAGFSSFDWNALDCPALAKRALEKCVASLQPVRIEPGRYTVILEPQAVADLVGLLMYGSMMGLFGVEVDGGGPWELGFDQGLEIWRTKLGLRVIDERVTITSKPFEPDQGVLPGPGLSDVTWFERGVLTNLSYRRAYGKTTRKEDRYVVHPGTYQMSGGTTTIDEMIATTKRGLLVTRFSDLNMLHMHSLLATGFTRDGLWLIENGKISKAVNNMRITESPIFVLNQIEQLGVPVPVFSPEKDWKKVSLFPTVVPPLKARDFSFTSTIDAV